MTAAQLQEWRDRHDHTLDSGAEALGVSRRQFADYLSGGYPIPRPVALLAAALDRLTRRPTGRRNGSDTLSAAPLAAVRPPH